jgi:hypothetical protein
MRRNLDWQTLQSTVLLPFRNVQMGRNTFMLQPQENLDDSGNT